MIFEEARQEPAGQDRSDERLVVVQGLLSKFHRAFPSIRFQLAPNFAAVNGNAAITADKRVVHLFGGLAFHPKVTSQALIFALLHETGHHLAPGHRLPWDPRLACECAADRWAASDGLGLFRTSASGRFHLASALEELELAAGSTNQPPKRKAPAWAGGCWAMCWTERKRCIKSDTASPRLRHCPLAQIMLRTQY